MNLSQEVNRQRLDNKMGVIKESEILHVLINEAFKKAHAVNGEIKLD